MYDVKCKNDNGTFFKRKMLKVNYQMLGIHVRCCTGKVSKMGKLGIVKSLLNMVNRKENVLMLKKHI